MSRDGKRRLSSRLVKPAEFADLSSECDLWAKPTNMKILHVLKQPYTVELLLLLKASSQKAFHVTVLARCD